MFSVLLMQDIAVVPVLVLIGALGAEGEGLFQRVVLSLAGAALVIPLILLVGSRVLGPLLRFIGARQDRDMFTAAALLVIIATAALTQSAGLSMALGAFLAGLVFADTEFVHQLEAEIAPFKGLLLGLFFLSVGMTVDPRVVVDAPLALGAVIVGVIVIKAFAMAALALVFRQPVAVAVESGLLLSQIGEFTLVALALGVTVGVVPTEIARVLVVAAGITMLLTTAAAPAILRLGRLIAERGESERLATTLGEAAPEGHVIIAGYGRIGQAIGNLLEGRRIPYIALDLNSQSVTRARRAGKPVHFGDVRRTDVLHNARAREARAIVLTMDNASANAAAIASLRQAGIATPVVARARDASNAQELYAVGADEVVLEAFEASLQMGEETLVSLGFPRDAAHAVIAEQREAGRRELTDAADGGRRR
jgi:CPA2 family monovalent cation:H+ antiporter-2